MQESPEVNYKSLDYSQISVMSKQAMHYNAFRDPKLIFLLHPLFYVLQFL